MFLLGFATLLGSGILLQRAQYRARVARVGPVVRVGPYIIILFGTCHEFFFGGTWYQGVYPYQA